MVVISMANHYHQTPSQILHINDPYTAYCLDQACWYITMQVRENKVPIFPKSGKATGRGQFSQLYNQLGVTSNGR